MAQGTDIFSFDEQPVKTNLIVQRRFAFNAARGKVVGCQDEDHETESVCRGDEDCTWDEQEEECKDREFCPQPDPRPYEQRLTGAIFGGAMGVIYEAPGGGNLLDDDVMGYMRKFEAKLLTTANGAKTSDGKLSPWNEDWCVRVYPGDSATASRCAPVVSISSIFSMTQQGREATKAQVGEGYSQSGSLGTCLCTHQDEICSICTDDGAVKNLSDIDFVLACISSQRRLQTSNETGNGTGTEGYCQASQGFSLEVADPSILTGFCAARPSCQWSPPGTSTLCSSTGYFASDWTGSVTGAEKKAILDKMCDETQVAWFNQRRQVFPQSFNCKDRVASFSMTFFFPGQKEPGDSKASEHFEKKYVQGGSGWYAKAAELEREIERESGGKLRIMIYSGATLQAQFLEILFIDIGLSGASLLMVFLYMWWTLESFFLASCAMFEIVFSLPVAMCLWTLILRQRIIFYQMLTVYMILGIGADDAFILYDAWLQARFAGPDVMQHWTTRFAYAYRKSFRAMAITTATTCCSFLIGAFSPLPTVRDFCIFAAVVVLVDWLFCVSFFASAVVVFERFFKTDKRPPGVCCGPGCCWGGARTLSFRLCGPGEAAAEPAEGSNEPPKKRAMERWCEGPVYNFLERWRILWVAVWVIIIISMAINAGVSLRTAEKQAPIGRENIDVTRGLEILINEFSVRGAPQVHFVYGLHAEEPIEDWGGETSGSEVPSYGSTSSITSEAGQAELLGLCRAADRGSLDNTRCSEGRTCLVLGRGIPGRCERDEGLWRSSGIYMSADIMCQNGRRCFIEEFAEYWAYSKDGCSNKSQVACQNASGCGWMSSPALCYSTTHPDNYTGLPRDQFLEELNGAGFAAYRENKQSVLRRLGRQFELIEQQGMTGWQTQPDGSGMRLAWVGFNGTIPRQNSVESANNWYDRWEDYRKAYGGSLDGFQTAEVYLFMVTQNEMVKAALLGIFLSLGVAYVVLVITTLNWWVSSLGMLNIVGISVVFLGIIPLLGWSLGENECIFLIAVVGLSVDYTVHLLHSYNHSHGDTRRERAKHALAEMGISVTNSAITTLLAAVILFGCGFYFFFQFGGFVFFVIGFSILMSITFLIPMLLLLGPDGDGGNIKCCRSRKPVVPEEIIGQEIITGATTEKNEP